MGIRKLNKFLQDNNYLKKYENLQVFKKKFNKEYVVIGIDFWLYTHKLLHSKRNTNILLGFWNQIIRFLKNGFIPIYIIDGIHPIIKNEEINNRINKFNNQIEKINIINQKIKDNNLEINELLNEKQILERKTKRLTKKEMNDIVELLNLLGISLIRAENECDKLCVKLYNDKIIDTCLSDDMDILVMGCGSMIKFEKKKIIEYDLEYILSNMNFTRSKLIDMCIVLGCDYIKHPIKINPHELFDLFKNKKDLFDIFENSNHKILNIHNSYVRPIGENYDEIFSYYYENDEKYNKINIKNIKNINTNDITKFFKNKSWFNINYNSIRVIENNINEINEIFKNY